MSCEVILRSLDGMHVIDLRGDVDSDAAPALDDAFEATSATDRARILLNFAEARYMNSSGIALIVELLRRARERGQALLACGLSDHYRHIFEVTRLTDYIEIHEDEDGAIAAARPSEMSP